jgi:predicted dehydrogenase
MLKGALIGCGFFAQNQLHAWNDIVSAEITALCDQDAARLGETADRFSISNTYRDAAELFERQDLDFVDIATTVGSHRPLVEAASEAGVNIICQKPFAPSMPDARAMVAAAQKTGSVLMVHENFRWQSAIRAALTVVREGAVGEPFFARISFRSGFDVYAAQPYLATDERFIIQDLGIHILDIARAFFGDVGRISADTKTVNPKIRGEDVATMILSHTGGVTSVVDCSYATRRRPETFPETLLEIDGDNGTLRLDAAYRLVVHDREKEENRDVSPPLLPWAERPWHNIQESVLAIQQHFVDCLNSGKQPETSGDDNLKTLALVEAAYLSAKEERTVRLDEI